MDATRRSFGAVGRSGVASGCVVFRFGSRRFRRKVNHSIHTVWCYKRLSADKNMYVYIDCRRSSIAVRQSGVGVGASDFSGDDDALDEIA